MIFCVSFSKISMMKKSDFLKDKFFKQGLMSELKKLSFVGGNVKFRAHINVTL